MTRRTHPLTRHRFPWPFDLLPTREVGSNGHADPVAYTTDQLAGLMGCHPRQIIRYHNRGLDYWAADRLATRVLNMHPTNIWPAWEHVGDQLITYELIAEHDIGGLFSLMRAHVQGTD